MDNASKIKTGIPNDRIDKAFIACSGPSARYIDWDSLTRLKSTVFSVNYTLYYLPRADYWYTFSKEIASDIRHNLPCVYVGSLSRVASEGVRLMQGFPAGSHHVARTPVKAMEETGFVFNGCLPNDSGFGCINLAIMMGARRIAVVGFDWSSCGHFYNSDAISHKRLAYEDNWNKRLGIAAQQCKELGIEILNGSPGSKCGAWPTVSAAEAIDWLETQS